MINTSKPTTSMTNTNKVLSAETWDSILTTWASETRTWTQVGSFLTNTARVSSSMTNTAKP